MPNRRKKPKLLGGVSRFISRFNRSGSSPLVVQTGFPTSLADLVVKNLSHLKKPKSVKKHSTVAPQSFVCTREDEIVEVVRLSETDDNVSSKTSNAVVRLQRPFDGPIGATKVSERDDVDVVISLASQEKTNRHRMIGIQATLLLLLALFVCCKELVLWIMSFAVVLLLLESFSSRFSFFQELDDPRAEKVKKNRGWENHIADKLRRSKVEEEGHPEVKSVEIEEEDDKDNNDKEGKIEDKDQNITIRSSNYLVLLIVVVLSGLIGGRILALGLTLICSYLVKISRLIGKKLRIQT